MSIKERSQPGVSAGLPSVEAVEKAKQCLADNGIEADETETVLEALSYILFNADIMHGSEGGCQHYA